MTKRRFIKKNILNLNILFKYFFFTKKLGVFELESEFNNSLILIKAIKNLTIILLIDFSLLFELMAFGQ